MVFCSTLFPRVGNQLFIYVGLRQAFAQHRLVMLGSDSLLSLITPLEAIVLRKKTFSRVGLFFLACCLSVLARCRLISRAYEEVVLAQPQLRIQRGLISSLVWFSDGYLQTSDIDQYIPSALKIKDELMANARQQLSAMTPASARLIFVHIRRGDYLYFPTRESPGVLPDSWVIAQMEKFRAAHTTPFFIVCSDEPDYAQQLFQGMDDVWVTFTSEAQDLALMACCHDGILSASTFSWWGGYFARRNQGHGRFVAPQYWLGHRQKAWWPYAWPVPWLEYVDTASTTK